MEKKSLLLVKERSSSEKPFQKFQRLHVLKINRPNWKSTL
jgi:hypothetical protein